MRGFPSFFTCAIRGGRSGGAYSLFYGWLLTMRGFQPFSRATGWRGRGACFRVRRNANAHRVYDKCNAGWLPLRQSNIILFDKTGGNDYDTRPKKQTNKHKWSSSHAMMVVGAFYDHVCAKRHFVFYLKKKKKNG